MNVATVVLDTLRKDAFERHFEWLSERRFDTVWSPSHLTVPVHGSLFTGCYPSETGVHAGRVPLDLILRPSPRNSPRQAAGPVRAAVTRTFSRCSITVRRRTSGGLPRQTWQPCRPSAQRVLSAAWIRLPGCGTRLDTGRLSRGSRTRHQPDRCRPACRQWPVRFPALTVSNRLCGDPRGCRRQDIATSGWQAQKSACTVHSRTRAGK